jgi:hypothetical protein
MVSQRRYYHTVNISHLPEVVRLTEEARKARRPIRLTIDDQDAGVLVPPEHPVKSRGVTAAASSGRTGSARRSQLLAAFGAVTPSSTPEDWRAVREGVEQAIAREAMGRS